MQSDSNKKVIKAKQLVGTPYLISQEKEDFLGHG